MISSKKYVDETLKANGLVANKALGQNFLVESDIAKEIVEKANVSKQTCVIEIGPGLGALTEILVEKAGLVKAFEIDENMVKILLNTFKEKDNIEINHIDFLDVDIEKLISDINKLGFNDIVFISNLPYYITSKLLNKMITNSLQFRAIIAMMQKEVGQKILKPDNKDYNQMAVIIDYQYDVSLVKYVGKNSYLPRPVIDSVVLKFEKMAPRYDVSLEKLIKVTQALFAYRRKTIYNNLKELFETTEEIENCLNTLNIDSKTRVEQLNIEQIVKICNYVK